MNTRNPEISQVQSKSTQTLDTQRESHAIGSLRLREPKDTPGEALRLYVRGGHELHEPVHLSTGSAQVTVTPAVGSPVTLVTNTYDNYGMAWAGRRGWCREPEACSTTTRTTGRGLRIVGM